MRISRRVETFLLNEKNRLKVQCEHGFQNCNCVKEFKLQLEMAKAAIPQKFWHFTFDNMMPQNKVSKATISKFQKYIKNVVKVYERGIGLFLFGDSGSGKTCSSSILLKEVIKAGYSARFTMLSEIITVFAEGWYDAGKRMEFIENICEVDFLVIDDVGREYRSIKSDLNRAAFDSVFRGRANDNLPTIITSNYNFLDEINSTDEINLVREYGHNLISLFKEYLIECPLIGFDFRQEHIAPMLEGVLDE